MQGYLSFGMPQSIVFFFSFKYSIVSSLWYYVFFAFVLRLVSEVEYCFFFWLGGISRERIGKGKVIFNFFDCSHFIIIIIFLFFFFDLTSCKTHCDNSTNLPSCSGSIVCIISCNRP